MIELKTDINKVERIELPCSWLAASGYQGTWGYIDSAGNFELGASGVDGPFFAVWTESYRDNSVGSFSPDTGETNKLTVLSGKYRATISTIDANTIANAVAGTPLQAADYGLLRIGTDATDATVVATCIKAPYSYEYLGTTYTVIDIITKS